MEDYGSPNLLVVCQDHCPFDDSLVSTCAVDTQNLHQVLVLYQCSEQARNVHSIYAKYIYHGPVRSVTNMYVVCAYPGKSCESCGESCTLVHCTSQKIKLLNCLQLW
jgi:hypothetical protein